MDECTTVRHKHLSKLADHLLQSSNISQSSKRSSHSDIDDAVNAAMQGLQTTYKEMEKIWKNNLRKKIEKTEKTVDPEMEKIWKNNRLAVYADMEKIWKNNVLTLQGQKKQTIEPIREQVWKNNI